MKLALLRTFVLAGAAATALTVSAPSPASADTASTAAIVGAALIVGGLILDSNRHQYYYVRSGHRYYVNNSTATYYRGHGGRYQGPDRRWHGSGYHGGGNNGRHY
jgi:hypothetical protein